MKYYVTYMKHDNHPRPKIRTVIAASTESLKALLESIEYSAGELELVSIVPAK